MSKRAILSGEVVNSVRRNVLFQVSFKWKGDVLSFEEAKDLVKETLGTPLLEEEDYNYWSISTNGLVINLSIMDMFPQKMCEGTLVILEDETKRF